MIIAMIIAMVQGPQKKMPKSVQAGWQFDGVFPHNFEVFNLSIDVWIVIRGNTDVWASEKHFFQYSTSFPCKWVLRSILESSEPFHGDDNLVVKCASVLEISVIAAIPFANGQNCQTRLVRPLLRVVGESASQTIQLDITDRFQCSWMARQQQTIESAHQSRTEQNFRQTCDTLRMTWKKKRADIPNGQ